jgi:hypothetical protein
MTSILIKKTGGGPESIFSCQGGSEVKCLRTTALRYYIAKKNYFHYHFKKKQTDYFYDNFAFYLKLVKTTIKSDKLRWLKSIDNNLKSQPQHFWKLYLIS